MLTVLGVIGSLVVVLVLIVLAVVAIAVAAMLVLAALAGSMADWRALWRRVTRREARLSLKLSGPAAPERLRAELSGGVPQVSRRFRLVRKARERRPDGRPRLRGVSRLTWR